MHGYAAFWGAFEDEDEDENDLSDWLIVVAG